MKQVSDKSDKSDRPRRGRTRQLQTHIKGLIAPVLRKQGFARTEIVSRWPVIVGEELARGCVPQKLVFPRGESTGGTLHVRANAATALELQHTTLQIIERINRFYGYRAVEKISITQGPLPRPDKRRHELRDLSPAEDRAIGQAVSGAGDDGLREALRSLARAILRRQPAESKESEITR